MSQEKCAVIVQMYGEFRAFSNVKITVSNVCYHHRPKTQYDLIVPFLGDIASLMAFSEEIVLGNDFDGSLFVVIQ